MVKATLVMKRYIHHLFAFVVALTSSQVHTIWSQGLGHARMVEVAFSITGDPEDYRMLVPLMSRLAGQITGVDPVIWMSILVVLSAFGMYYALRSLSMLFMDSERASLAAFLGCEAGFILLVLNVHVYDIPTMMFVSLALTLLAKKKYLAYYLLFPIASFNRETTFLLIAFFLAFGFTIMPRHTWILGVLYQIVAWILVRWLVISLLPDIPRDMFYWTFPRVITDIPDRPLLSLVVYTPVLVIMFFTLRGWTQKPGFLRLAFLVFFPSQVLLYLTVGLPMELRVLAESLPVICCLCAYPVPTSLANTQYDYR